jgi:hypothetical protein
VIDQQQVVVRQGGEVAGGRRVQTEGVESEGSTGGRVAQWRRNRGRVDGVAR